MPLYCEVCGEELAPEDEEEGICQSCKLTRSSEVQEEKKEIYDPGIT
jgi:hypothetical protein